MPTLDTCITSGRPTLEDVEKEGEEEEGVEGEGFLPDRRGTGRRRARGGGGGGGGGS